RKSVTFNRNRRSRSVGTTGHVQTESAVNLVRNTHVLYEPLPRSIQVQKRRAAGQVPNVRAKQDRCDAIDNAKKRINAQMRRGYTNGEPYREQLRRLSAKRWELGCGENIEIR